MQDIDLGGVGRLSLVDSMGGDLTIVNSARASYDQQTDTLREKDARLINFLWDNEHTSPFRHSTLQFHITAPIFVLRQWMKHQIGCSWNERSGRYTKFNDEWYRPDVIFKHDPNVKQGSHTKVTDEAIERILQCQLERSFREAYENYQHLLSQGISKEQARAVLPVGMMSSCYWTASLQAVMHFLELRLDNHSQYEIRLFASGVYALVKATGKFDHALLGWRERFLQQRPHALEDEVIRETFGDLC